MAVSLRLVTQARFPASLDTSLLMALVFWGQSGEEERYTHLNLEFQRIARRDKKDFLSDQCKEIGQQNVNN